MRDVLGVQLHDAECRVMKCPHVPRNIQPLRSSEQSMCIAVPMFERLCTESLPHQEEGLWPEYLRGQSLE